ncbi:MAG: hypothetical protein GF350_10610 [Chitinivibrionales bacterium]|nr:hypothetical protein [Chitinivibrionales bacterium]
MGKAKLPYEKPQVFVALMSSETLQAECTDPVPLGPGSEAFVGTTVPLCANCSNCKEGVASA